MVRMTKLEYLKDKARRIASNKLKYNHLDEFHILFNEELDKLTQSKSKRNVE